MKKCILIILTITLLASCSKEKCWKFVDCLGNDAGVYCGSEKQVQDQCKAMSTPTCTMGYIRE